MLNTEEAAKALEVSRGTLFHMIEEGSIRPQPKPASLRRVKAHWFDPDEVERVKREGRKPPAGE